MSRIEEPCEEQEAYSRFLKHKCTHSDIESVVNYTNEMINANGNLDIKKFLDHLPLFWKVLGNLRDLLVHKSLDKDSRGVNTTALKFIVDTLKFIKTGKREVSILSWKELLTYTDYYCSSVADSDMVRGSEIMEYIKDCDFILNKKDTFILWCSKENGLQDMLCTVSILLDDAYFRESGRPLNDSRIHVRF